MSGLPLHPAIVHIPIGAAVVVPLLAAFLAVAIRKQWLPRKSWIAVLLLQAVVVGGASLALNTGEHEEERVEHVVGEAAIEEHEEAAKAFTFTAVGALVLAGAALALHKRRNLADALNGATVLVLLATLGLGAWTGHEGGKLVYEKGAASVYVNAPAGGVQPAAGRDYDDD